MTATAQAALLVLLAVTPPVPSDGAPVTTASAAATRVSDDVRSVKGRIHAVTGSRPEPNQHGVLLGEARFCIDCDVVTARDREALRELAAALPPGSCVAVVGHADRTGTDEHNLDLSQRRAEAAADVLRDESLPDRPLRVTTGWLGEAEPRGGPLAADRRAEVRATTTC